MRMRTEDEINAYIDGFNACFRMFSDYLKTEPNAKVAEEKMDLMVVAVNNVARKQVDYAQLD